MMRPLSPTTLTDLPDEILLNICAQTTYLTRNSSLANLSRVSKRLRPIAQEWLLKEPRFNLAHIDKYMWELFSRPRLVPQVRTLEIWSSSQGRYERDERGRSVKRYAAMKLTAELLERTQYVKLIINSRSTRNDTMGVAAVQNDVFGSLFCHMVYGLPNLQKLRLGAAWLMDFPFFVCLLSYEACQHGRLPRAWQNPFSTSAYAGLSSQLTVLDVPADMTAMLFNHRVLNVFDFRSLSKLKELGLSMKALQNFEFRRIVRDPREVFPGTLEVLRISEASYDTANHLHSLCIAKKGGHFPALRRVEVFHMKHLRACAADARFTVYPTIDMRAIFKDAKVALLLHFPPWAFRTWDAGGTPWSLRMQNGAVEEGEQRTFYTDQVGTCRTLIGSPRFEKEWDSDGDTVMKGSRNGIA